MNLIDREEKWADVPGYAGIYQVSSFGNLKSVYRWRRNSGNIQGSENRDGYTLVKLYKTGSKPKTVGIHVLVALAFFGQRPEGMEVNHIDGNKLNNSKENLEYITKRQNIKHAADNQMRWVPFGEKCKNAKLTQSAVDEIREIASKSTQKYGLHRMLADRFKVGRTTISAIISGRNWVIKNA